ncbi:MAG TPA: hypothetical protein VK249_04265 [Anaerolineales bacterium]|nr:hypothetical protein [Anaerolineales bacterium]
MQKRTLIYIGIVVLIVLLIVHVSLLLKEKPQYVTLEIPMPRADELLTYTGKNAMSEEFSTYVWNDPLGHRYFVHRMYVSVKLGKDSLETENDVENYYDTWLKKLGWEETGAGLCDGQMAEFPPESYRAYVNPNVNNGWAVTCLVTWLEFDNEDYSAVLIKTINPSENVASCDQAMPTTGFILLYLVSYAGRQSPEPA